MTVALEKLPPLVGHDPGNVCHLRFADREVTLCGATLSPCPSPSPVELPDASILAGGDLRCPACRRRSCPQCVQIARTWLRSGVWEGTGEVPE